MKIKVKIEIGLDITEKRLLKLGFKKKDFQYFKEPKAVFVIGRCMGDTGSFHDTIIYDPYKNEISSHYGGNFPMFDNHKVDSMYDIKKFLKERSHEDDEAKHELKYGKASEGFDVVMVRAGLSRINVMKLLRDELDLPVQECKAFVDSTPKVIKNCFTGEDAKELKRKFEEVGAEIELK